MSVVWLSVARSLLLSALRGGFVGMLRFIPGFPFLQRVWALSAPFWLAPEAKSARYLLVGFVAIKLALIYVAVRQNAWFRDFYAAIQGRDVDAFIWQAFFFAGLASLYIAGLVISHRLGEAVKLRWRDFMVARATQAWLSNRAYLTLQRSGPRNLSPDARIAADIGLFGGHTVDLVIGFCDVTLSFCAFIGILWSLSGTIDIAGYAVPGTLVFLVLIYSVAATVVTHLIGHPLMDLKNNNQKLEAQFSFRIMRLRENAETVAFYGGEKQEISILSQHWKSVMDNFKAIIAREYRISWFATGFNQFNIIVPFLMAAPRYFSGQIDFGQVMQIAAAFGAVQVCLGFFISSYSRLAEWVAVTDRLEEFLGLIAMATRQRAQPFARQVMDRGLSLQAVTLTKPDGAVLLRDVSLDVAGGEAVLLKGPSGSGKSTLLRAAAGIWSHGSGQIAMPATDLLFVPQKPYLPNATLREALCYPAAPHDDDHELRSILDAVSLGHLADRLDDADDWGHVLSGGEQQRIGFARVLVNRPHLVFLDEATSALDEDMEKRLYRLLRAAPWQPTLVSVGHRGTLSAYHDRDIDVTDAQADRRVKAA
jgi:putative ATP-binding cassette transporter